MASLVGGLLGHLKPGTGSLFGGSRAKPGQVTVRGASKRAYVFEVHRREAQLDFGEVGAVYMYARTAAPEGAGPAAPRDAAGVCFEPGFIGRTADLGRRDAEHDLHGHFVGFAFDVVLVMRVDQEPIRADIESDLIELHRPVLNELLRGYQGSSS